jgi:hypothetical protein
MRCRFSSTDWASASGLRAVATTGTGEKTFSSGYTLQAIARELDDRLERLLDTLESLPTDDGRSPQRQRVRRRHGPGTVL